MAVTVTGGGIGTSTMTDCSLLVLNGPGLAHPDVDTGDVALQQIEDMCSAVCDELGIALDFRHSDDADEIIGWIGNDCDDFDALVINPFGKSRSESVDINKYRAAIGKVSLDDKPVIEVHLANFFHEGAGSTTALEGPVGAKGFICGLGVDGYALAIRAVEHALRP